MMIRHKNLHPILPISILILILTGILECKENLTRTQTRNETELAAFWSLFQSRQQRRLYEDTGEYDPDKSTECYCGVMVDGGNNLRGDEAICGKQNFAQTIICPMIAGCQIAKANVRGFMSTVKTCGYGMDVIGCRLQKEPLELVGTTLVQRCYCLGNLCNSTSTIKAITSVAWIFFFYIILQNIL